MEVQPSESIRLKVSSTIVSKMFLAEFGTTASVMITQSIVAKAGASIPAPFAIPLIWAPKEFTVEIFGTESVVMIACAHSANESSLKFAATTSKPLKILSIGKNSPIMPVEHTNTSADECCKSEATCSALLCVS